MAQKERTGRPKTASLTLQGPVERRSRATPARDTTIRQVGQRLNQAESMVADGLAEIAVLRALQADMRARHVPSVARLSPELRADHREAIRLASGAHGGVELW
jgi:hypothetical protein